MDAVIYARFSSHSQNEQSIEGQLSECYAFAEREGYRVIGEYIDRAQSATTDNRPQFLKMIEDSNKKQFQYILVYQLDRFARNRYDSAINKAKLKKNGVRVLSARENITDDASGALIEGVLESMAEYYSKELSQKVKRGLNINAQKCLATGGYITPGFKVGDDRRYHIDEDTAPVIKEIFDMYAGGKTVDEILKYLEARQLKSIRGNSYNKSSVLRWLRNKNYIGIYTYKETEVPDGMPRIVSDELFEQVQRRLGKNKASPARAKAKEEYILTTKLFCGKCRDMMVGFSGTGKLGKIYHYYSCNNYRRKKCKMTNKPKQLFEDAIVLCAKGQLTDENIERLSSIIEEVCNKDKRTDKIKRLQRLLKENEKQRANLISALRVQGASESTTKTIYEELTKLEQAHELIEKDISDESLVKVNMTKSKIKAFLNGLKDGDVNDLIYRKTLINIFINKVYAYGKWLMVTFNTQDKAIELDAEFLDKLEADLSEQIEGLYLEPSVPPRRSKVRFAPIFFCKNIIRSASLLLLYPQNRRGASLALGFSGVGDAHLSHSNTVFIGTRFVITRKM